MNQTKANTTINTIQYKGKIYVFPPTSPNEDELPKIYTDRLWFIIKNINKSSIEHVVNMSYIWSNHKYFNLEYDHHIMSELSEYTVQAVQASN
jgi:hypothetical protein